MAFIDRIVDHPGRIILTPVEGEPNTYDVTRAEGIVTQEGTLLNAANLNKETQLDPSVAASYTAAGAGSDTNNGMSDALKFVFGKVKGIDTGTANGWNFVKLTPSIFIATRQVTPSLAINTAAGSLYTTSAEYDIALPSFTTGTLFISGDANGGRWITMTNVGTSPKWRLYSPVAVATSAITVDFFLVGTY